MRFSDVTINIQGRHFPAHKNILATRSEVFAAMFEHLTNENLTNQITIEDIEPEVFHQLLRFMYTKRLTSETMDTMAAALLIAADKYMIGELKSECQNHLLRNMSAFNCVELILRCDLLDPAEHLKEVVKEATHFFRCSSTQVMATKEWKTVEEENPDLISKIQKFFCQQQSITL